jgi:hypothetical protein
MLVNHYFPKPRVIGILIRVGYLDKLQHTQLVTHVIISQLEAILLIIEELVV